MMRKLLLLLLVVILFASCKQNKPVKIAFLGNSITIGSGLEFPETECYPSLIGQKLNEQFNGKYVIENYAVSGRTMLRMGDNPLWDEPQFSASLAFSPDIVYIMLGTNDSKPQNWDSFGTEFMADYQAMLDTFKTVNPNVKFILAYPPPAFEVQWGIRDSVIVNGVMPVVSALIEKNKTYSVNFYEPLLQSPLLFPDAIHPNAQGAQEMANILFDVLIETGLVK